MDVKKISDNGKELKLLINGTDTAMMNALRRTIMNSVPVLAIDKVRGPQPAIWVAIGAAAIGSIILGGHPQVVLYIMYAGFLFVTSRGNSEQVIKARTALLWAIVGGVIVVGAKIIIEIIQTTVTPLITPLITP